MNLDSVALAQLLEAQPQAVLVDVRESYEQAACIPGGRAAQGANGIVEECCYSQLPAMGAGYAVGKSGAAPERVVRALKRIAALPART